MLCPEDQATLGLPVAEHASRNARPSAVSQALRAIRDELEGAPDDSPRLAFQEPGLPGSFRVAVANDRALRERAFALAFEVYREKGYVKDEPEGRLASPYDAGPEAITLLAETPSGHAAGTITLYCDGPLGLPCDAIFGAELAALRAAGRRPLEVARLAIAPDHQHSQALVRRLMNLSFIYAKRVKRCTDSVIEVNPRHAGFYRRFLKFETLGPERPCPRVEGAPAVLLRADLDIYAEALARKEAGTLSGSGLERTLYAKFLPRSCEADIGVFLAKHQRAMSAAEARYFAIEPVSPAMDAPARFALSIG